MRGPSLRLNAWAAQLRRNVAMVASRWRHCVDLTGLGIEPQTSRTDSVRLATELTAGQNELYTVTQYSLKTTASYSRVHLMYEKRIKAIY